jgi:hypothetical protein
MTHDTCEGCRFGGRAPGVDQGGDWVTWEPWKCSQFGKTWQGEGQPTPMTEDCWEPEAE